MREYYVALVWIKDESSKPERVITHAKDMNDVVNYINKLYPERRLLTISKANAFDIRKDDEVYKI